jgi:alpha-galactosidase
MSSASFATVSNTRVIAIDQDPAGVQGTLVPNSSIGNGQVWIKPLSDGSFAVALLNRGQPALQISTTASALQIPLARGYKVTNIWTNQHSTSTGTFTALVQGYATVLLRITPG